MIVCLKKYHIHNLQNIYFRATRKIHIFYFFEIFKGSGIDIDYIITKIYILALDCAKMLLYAHKSKKAQKLDYLYVS